MISRILGQLVWFLAFIKLVTEALTNKLKDLIQKGMIKMLLWVQIDFRCGFDCQ